jgi:hypothetical protein
VIATLLAVLASFFFVLATAALVWAIAEGEKTVSESTTGRNPHSWRF